MRPGGQHAYFPALIICVAFADLLSGVYAGKVWPRLSDLKIYAKRFMPAEYTSDPRRLDFLYEVLRHKVAHLAYPYPVFKFQGRGVTWAIHSSKPRPVIKVSNCPTK